MEKLIQTNIFISGLHLVRFLPAFGSSTVLPAVVFILSPEFVFVIDCSLGPFMPTPHRFDCCNFVVSFDTRQCEFFSFALFFRVALAIRDPLRFHFDLGWVFLYLKKQSLGF